MSSYREEEKYYPLLVTMIQGKQDTDDIFNTMWSKFDLLPQKQQNILTSDKIVDFIYGIERKYSLQGEQVEQVSRIIRNYFFRYITEEIFAKNIASICNTTIQDGSQILKAIKNINIKDVNKKQTIKLSLNNAIQKYPQILKQQITNKKIVTKPFLKPLVPSVKNWIMVYEKILGVSAHTMIERGNFVFRSEATKGLSEESRKKLLTLFKSRDDNSELIIDADEGLIIFVAEQVKDKEVDKRIIKQTPVQDNVIVQNDKILKQDNIQQNQSVAKPLLENNENLYEDVNVESKNPQVRRLSGIDDVNAMNRDVKLQKQNVKKQVTSRSNVMVDTVKATTTQVENKSNSIQSPNLSQDVQEEIVKNRVEMGDKEVDKKKIKKNNNERKQSQIGTPVQKTNNKITKQRTIVDAQEKIEKKPQERGSVYGEVSFSSNHVMPAEQKKQSVAPAKYSAFSMKPLGQAHKEKVEEIKDVEEVV